MPSKDFEQTVRFREINTPNGPVWLPIVTVVLISPNGNRFTLPLFFDTGASVTTLKSDLYRLLGLGSWDEGEIIETNTGGGAINVYKYTAKL